jgi:ABC-2 type transport system ATP-binding protein
VPPLAFVQGVTLLPALLLLILQIVFAGSLAFLRANLFLLPAITLFSLAQALLSACAILALSSLSKSRRFVAVMYAGIIFFTAAMYQVLRGITSSRTWAVISPGEMLDVIANAIFRGRGEPAVPVYVAVIGRGLMPSPTAGQPVITAEHLSKWYGQVSGLNDVSVRVPPGITGLLGPNGSGKSTFMKLVTGQLKPSKGAVQVFGEPIWGNPALYHRIGFCPEQDAFYERMTGLGWVTALVALNGLGPAEAEAAARRALEAVDLLDAADKKIGAYSKGMRQRVKMAQALAHDPEVLILDEPLSGMDPLMRRRTIRLIREWGRSGKSVLVSSHILHEIESMTSNILLINNGRILAEGNVHQIRELIDTHPHSVFIRAEDPKALARALLVEDGVISLRFEPGAVSVETARPDAFYARLTEMAASGEAGVIDEVTSPDDNLQAVFKYLVKQ